MKNSIFLLILFVAIVFNQKSEAQETKGNEELARKDTVNIRLQKADLLLKQGNTEEASKIYTGIMQSDPNNKEAVQRWLMVNMKRSPTGEEDAIKQLEELSKKYPENSAIIFFKAFVEGEYGHNEEALKDIEWLIKVQPDDALNYIMKGQVLYGMKAFDEACKAFDKAASLDPEKWDVWGMKALSLAKTGRYDEAIISINKGIELAPDQPNNIYNRACIYCMKGDKANALADLQKAISLNLAFKETARKDEDFKSLYDDEDFKKITL
jgi:tetratricopeptide (TPR) repeat protein